MATTLVGIFDDFSQAQAAVRALDEAGIERSDINIVRNEPAGKGYTTYGGANSKDYSTGSSIGDKISDFFGSVFGADVDEEERGIYAEAARRGSVVVTVAAEDETAERAADILNRHGAVDVDRRAAQYRAAGYRKYDRSAPLYTAEQSQTEFKDFSAQGEVAIPVIEENLQVGKRVVQRGGVRVHTRVTERPVEETVSLREEHVNVERRPANREVSEADMAAVREGDFTVRTRAEEAVVGKEARIVEEVVVGKEVTERSETVRETVKRTDVKVEEIDGDADSNPR